MGTNYYRVPTLTEERKKKLYELIDQEKWHSNWYEEDNYESSVSSMVNMFDNGIHICKISWGWQVCFDHNWGKYYKPNKKSLRKFLSEEGYIIKDEYGDTYTPKEFWKLVKEHNANPECAWVSKTYDEWECKRNPNYKHYPCIDDRNKVFTTFGIRCDSEDFAVDGLRFAVFSDFS